MASKKTARTQQAVVLTAEIAKQWCDSEEDTPLERQESLIHYTQIEDTAAEILGQSGGWRELDLSGLTTLTPTAAQSLAQYEGSLVLNGIRKIDPEIAQILARRGERITLLEGLETLDDRDLAKMLAASGEETGDIYLRRLRKLSPRAAKVLSKADCFLSFGGHANLGHKVNGILGKANSTLRFFGRKRLTLKDVVGLGADGETHEGELIFTDVRKLDTDAAAELARYPGAVIRFSVLENISLEVAAAIAPYRGTLDLRNVSTFSPEAAVALANRTADTLLQGHSIEAIDGSLIVRLDDDSVFNLGEVRRLTPELAATLAAAPILDFRNLKKLTPQAAHVLAEQHHGSLLLDGLESLPNNVAAALSRHDGGLSFRGLQRLSLSAAQSLMGARGFLSLGGLKKIGPRLAAVLAGFSGNLMLDGVTELTPGVARKLQKHTGILSMNGVKEISEETAKILAGKPNQKRMVRCGGSVAAVQYLLKNDPDRVTMMFRLNSDGAFE